MKSKSHISSLFFVLLCCINFCFAQDNSVKELNHPFAERLVTVQKGIKDQLLVCAIRKQNNGSKASIISVYDTSGILLWTKDYSKPTGDLIFTKVLYNTKQEIAVVGYESNPLQNTSKSYAALLKNNGDVIWENYYGESNYDRISDVWVDAKNDMYVCGTTKVTGEGTTDMLVAKINYKGKKVWVTNVGQKFINDRGTSISGKENSILVAGTSFAALKNKRNLYVAHLDGRGTVYLQKNYDALEADSAFTISNGTDYSSTILTIAKSPEGYTSSENLLIENSLELQKTNPIWTGNSILAGKVGNTILFIEPLKKQSSILVSENNFQQWYKIETPIISTAQILYAATSTANYCFSLKSTPNDPSNLYMLKLSTTTGSYNSVSWLKAVVQSDSTDTEIVDFSSDKIMRGGGDPFKGTNIANASKEIKVGKYYALIIAVDQYTGAWTPLNNAVNDAKTIENTLRTKYRVDVFKTLYNGQATRNNIIEAFEWLGTNVKENDNVMIFYSGHGEFKKDLDKGYWVPSDAKTISTSQYISNSDIQTYIVGIKSKHTLLVSDACFSGDIFRGNTTTMPFEKSEKYYHNVYGTKSRQAITSGGIEPVMDGGKNGHSVFAYYLIQALENNDAKYFDAGQLFNKLKVPVANNSDQSPSFNPIKNTGDEGGQFIFIKK